jgi:hypothetical protein
VFCFWSDFTVYFAHGFSCHCKYQLDLYRGDNDGHGRDRYRETETTQLLSKIHIQSLASLKSSEMPTYVQFRRSHGDGQMLHVLPPQFNPPNYQVSFHLVKAHVISSEANKKLKGLFS